MTKDEELAMDLALEALKSCSGVPHWPALQPAITAIKKVRALDKMAENARELGLDYEPVPENFIDALKFDVAMRDAAPVQEDWGPGPHECHSLTSASVQEPVAWRYRGILHDFDPSDWAEGPVTPLYTTPPAQREWVGLTNDEINEFADGCHLGNSVQGAIFKAQAKLKELNT